MAGILASYVLLSSETAKNIRSMERLLSCNLSVRGIVMVFVSCDVSESYWFD